MLANVRQDYVLEVIDPAVVPEEEAKPHRILIIVIGALLGATLSIAAVTIFQYRHQL